MTGALVDVNVPAVFAIAVSNAVSWNIIDCDAQPITVASTATDTSLCTDDIVMLRLDLTTATEGADTNTSTIFSLATVPFPSTTCFNWTPDASLSTAATYCIAFSALDSLGTVMSIDYSHWFSLSSGESAPDATYCDCEDDEDGSMGAESPSPANKVFPTTEKIEISASTTSISTRSSTSFDVAYSGGQNLREICFCKHFFVIAAIFVVISM